MPPSDPAAVPPPEWASRVAEGFFGSPRVTSDALACLLASVREGALREAAERSWESGGSCYTEWSILTLIGQSPKEVP